MQKPQLLTTRICNNIQMENKVAWILALNLDYVSMECTVINAGYGQEL